MSEAVVYYDDLKDAASEARHVAKRMGNYASELKNQILKDMNQYDGPSSPEVSEARNQVSKKIDELERRENAYTKYAADLDSLKTICETTDQTVKVRVSELTASFKLRNGIWNNPVINGISYFFTSIVNSTFIGRFLNRVDSRIEYTLEYVKTKAADWYKYDGGSILITNTVLAVIGTAAAVVTAIEAVAAAIAGATFLTVAGAVAAVVLALTAAVGLCINVINNAAAYHAAQNGDPVTARRLDSVETIQDQLRKSDNRSFHEFANWVDEIEFAANVINFVNSAKELAGKGYQWITNSSVAAKDFKWKNADAGELWKGIKEKFKTAYKHVSEFKWKDISVEKTVDYLRGKRIDRLIELQEKEPLSRIKERLSAAQDGMTLIDAWIRNDKKTAWKSVGDWALDQIEFKSKNEKNNFSARDVLEQGEDFIKLVKDAGQIIKEERKAADWRVKDMLREDIKSITLSTSAYLEKMNILKEKRFDGNVGFIGGQIAFE